MPCCVERNEIEKWGASESNDDSVLAFANLWFGLTPFVVLTTCRQARHHEAEAVLVAVLPSRCVDVRVCGCALLLGCQCDSVASVSWGLTFVVALVSTHTPRHHAGVPKEGWHSCNEGN